MNGRFPKFLGREIELNGIKEAIERKDSSPFWLDIIGVGGVGKTTLLKQISSAFATNGSYLITGMIDFSQVKHFTRSWVMNSVASVDRDGFSEYLALAQSIRHSKGKASETGASEHLNIGILAERKFIECASAVASRKNRLVVLIDTFENVKEIPRLYNFIQTVFSQIGNLTLIAAGREVENGYQPTQELFPQKQEIKLEGFTQEEAMEYFERSSHGKGINQSLRKKLLLLTKGLPILLALAIEWMHRKMSLPILTQISEKELEEMSKVEPQKYKELRNDFEFQLVQIFLDLEEPLKDIMLNMAHVYRRFNRDLLKRLTNIQDIEKTIETMRELPFIKFIDEDTFILHDEIQRLINLYNWQIQDQQGNMRIDLNRIVVEYYDDKLKLLQKEVGASTAPAKITPEKEFEIRVFRLERMFYLLGIDFTDGFREFDRLFEEFKNRHRDELAALAIRFIKEYKEHLSSFAMAFLDTYHEGWLCLRRQEYLAAQSKIEKGLKGLLEQIPEADDKNQIDKMLKLRIGDVYNLLGFCHRLQGNHQDAIKNYEKAIKSLRANLGEDNFVDKNNQQYQKIILQIAETLNNEANVYRMLGALEKARQLCQISLILRDRWGSPRDVGNSLYVMARINWEIGGTAEAIRYLRRARQQYSRIDLAVNQAWVDRYEGYVRFRIGLLEEAVPYIKKALAAFDENYEQGDLVETLNDLARIFLENTPIGENPDLAIDTADKALEIAEHISDQYRECECCLTLANIYLRLLQNVSNDTEKQPYENQINQFVERGSSISKGKFNLLESMFADVRGVLAYEKGDYFTAFDEFLECCNLSRLFKTAFFERSMDTLGSYLLKLAYQDKVEESELQCERCKDSWMTKYKLADEYPQLIEEIDTILATIYEIKARNENLREFEQLMRETKYSAALQRLNRSDKNIRYHHDKYFAQILFNKARVMRWLHKYTEARRLCRISLSIRRELKLDREIGESHYFLGKILWDIGNTKEAADEMREAEKYFEKAGYELGFGYVNRFWGYLLSRVHLYPEAERRLEQAARFCNKYDHYEGLADIYNTQSRMVRARTKIRKDLRLKQAIEYAHKALDMTKRSGNKYQQGEIYLSLVFAHYLEEEDLPEPRFEMAKKYYRLAKKTLGKQNPLLLGILEGVYGLMLYKSGDYTKAFQAFFSECRLSLGTKHMRYPRAMEILSNHLSDLPTKQAYEQIENLQNSWKEEGLQANFPEFINALALIKDYHNYFQTTDNKPVQ